MAQATKGPQRQKHVPQRTCVACRRSDAKRGLLRVVRDADARVMLDPTGKRSGRGAYLCHDPQCWQQALKRRALERALKVEQLHPDDRASLLAFAATLAQETSSAEEESLEPAPAMTTGGHPQGEKGR